MIIKGLTLLSKEDVFGEEQVDVIKKFGATAATTDLAILTTKEWISTYQTLDDDSLKGRTWAYYTKSSYGDGEVLLVSNAGKYSWAPANNEYSLAIRPVLNLPKELFSKIWDSAREVYRYKGNGLYKVDRYNGLYEVEYGEYPQWAAPEEMQKILEHQSLTGLSTTGRSYTLASVYDDSYSESFQPVQYEEYEYNEKKYIRFKTLPHKNYFADLSNGVEYVEDDYVWLEVSPITWLVDFENKRLISKRNLLSGIRFNYVEYFGKFEDTEMYEFLNKYMLKDMFQKLIITPPVITESTISNIENQLNNPEGLTKEELEVLLDALKQIKGENNTSKR